MKNRNFNEIYQKLQQEKNPILDNLRIRKIIAGSIVIALIIIGFFFFMNYRTIFNKYSYKIPNSYFFLAALFVFAEIIAIIFYAIESGKYSSLFKQTVISSLVKQYCETLNYNRISGMSSREYDMAGYRESYDRFHSEDLIYGNFDDEFTVKMSEVKTERRETTTDSHGNTRTHYVTVFQGIYGYIDVKDKILPYFEVCSNRFFGKYNKSRIEVDSAEFEKDYDLYTEDKVRTMEIFTADLIEKFNRFKTELKTPIQIKVVRGTMYFRLRSTNSFEAPTFGNSLDFSSTLHNFKVIDEPFRLISGIFENAKS